MNNPNPSYSIITRGPNGGYCAKVMIETFHIEGPTRATPQEARADWHALRAEAHRIFNIKIPNYEALLRQYIQTNLKNVVHPCAKVSPSAPYNQLRQVDSTRQDLYSARPENTIPRLDETPRERLTKSMIHFIHHDILYD